jgi:Fungal specific transcription factor domain
VGAISVEAGLGIGVFASTIARMTGRATARGATTNSFVYMLRHFEENAFATLSSPTGQQILKTKIPSIVQQYPFLLHSVLAYSSTHLKHLGQVDREMCMASRFHTQRALQLYVQHLSQPVPDQDMDAMFAACLMLTGLFFVGVGGDLDPTKSWIMQRTFRWVTTASGLTTLVRAQKGWNHLESVWLKFLIEARTAVQQDQVDLQALPSPLLDLCEYDRPSASHNPYKAALQLLGSVVKVEPGAGSFARQISFLHRLHSDFVELIYRKDARALLVLGYWFALMCRIPYWWCLGRMRGECRAICLYLENDADFRIRELLHFPKEACGYMNELGSQVLH